MILYFTGTGNSAYIANRLGKLLDDEVVSINDHLQNDVKPVTYASEKPLIFVTPTYAWRMPLIVEKFIQKSGFSGNRQAYFILNCGDAVANAEAPIHDLCDQKHFEFMGFAKVVMPENYIALFRCPEPGEAKEIIRAADTRIEELARYISHDLPFPPHPPRAKFLTSIINPFFYKFIVKDKHFFATDACISCNKCVELCPLNNITLEGKDQKPVWHGNCTHCMACISACPTEAIQYKKKTIGKTRYYLNDNEIHY